MQMRLATPLPEATEELVRRVIGCAIQVHRVLGPGLLEGIYKQAMCVELREHRIRYACEKPVYVTYRGVRLGGQRVDLLVEDRIVVELKAVARFEPIHEAQVISYLKALGLRIGLLMNFNEPVLAAGLRRIVR